MASRQALVTSWWQARQARQATGQAQKRSGGGQLLQTESNSWTCPALLFGCQRHGGARSLVTDTGLQAPAIQAQCPEALSGLSSSAMWNTMDRFLFAVYHDDRFPRGGDNMGPEILLAGRQIGSGAEVDGACITAQEGSWPRAVYIEVLRQASVVRHGRIDHTDSLGCAGRFGRGDVQWMTAGTGIVHSMFPLLDQQREPHGDVPNLAEPSGNGTDGGSSFRDALGGPFPALSSGTPRSCCPSDGDRRSAPPGATGAPPAPPAAGRRILNGVATGRCDSIRERLGPPPASVRGTAQPLHLQGRLRQVSMATERCHRGGGPALSSTRQRRCVWSWISGGAGRDDDVAGRAHRRAGRATRPRRVRSARDRGPFQAYQRTRFATGPGRATGVRAHRRPVCPLRGRTTGRAGNVTFAHGRGALFLRRGCLSRTPDMEGRAMMGRERGFGGRAPLPTNECVAMRGKIFRIVSLYVFGRLVPSLPIPSHPLQFSSIITPRRDRARRARPKVVQGMWTLASAAALQHRRPRRRSAPKLSTALSSPSSASFRSDSCPPWGTASAARPSRGTWAAPPADRTRLRRPPATRRP